ncbi:MAG: hypothetical protein RR623_10125 [Bacilli bacterium]
MYDRWKYLFDELAISFQQECIIKHNNSLYNGKVELNYNSLQVFLECDIETLYFECYEKNTLTIDVIQLNNNFKYISLNQVVYITINDFVISIDYENFTVIRELIELFLQCKIGIYYSIDTLVGRTLILAEIDIISNQKDFKKIISFHDSIFHSLTWDSYNGHYSKMPFDAYDSENKYLRHKLFKYLNERDIVYLQSILDNSLYQEYKYSKILESVIMLDISKCYLFLGDIGKSIEFYTNAFYELSKYYFCDYYMYEYMVINIFELLKLLGDSKRIKKWSTTYQRIFEKQKKHLELRSTYFLFGDDEIYNEFMLDIKALKLDSKVIHFYDFNLYFCDLYTGEVDMDKSISHTDTFKIINNKKNRKGIYDTRNKYFVKWL